MKKKDSQALPIALITADAKNDLFCVLTACFAGVGRYPTVTAALDALAAGADTFVSGRIGYNTMVEASEMGINLLEAGHFFTEHPVTSFFLSLLHRIDREMYIEVRSSNNIRLI